MGSRGLDELPGESCRCRGTPKENRPHMTVALRPEPQLGLFGNLAFFPPNFSQFRTPSPRQRSVITVTLVSLFFNSVEARKSPRGAAEPLQKGGSRPGGSRTPNNRIWRPVLYQLELLAWVLGGKRFAWGAAGYFASLCSVCLRSHRQYFFLTILVVLVFLFRKVV